MKLMRLTQDVQVKFPVQVAEGHEPYSRTYTAPQYTQVEVLSESDGMMRVRARVQANPLSIQLHDIEFEVTANTLFIPQGLRVDVYRPADGADFSLGGITSRYTRAILCGPDVDEIFEETEDCPALTPYRSRTGYLSAVPYGVTQPIGRYAFGGNFVYSSDSRVSRLCPGGCGIPVHDRDMSKERR